MDNIPAESVWTYKDQRYRVNSVLLKNLSQDPDTGEWQPTVRYTLEPANGLVFYRSYSEWLGKFERYNPEAPKASEA